MKGASKPDLDDTLGVVFEELECCNLAYFLLDFFPELNLKLLEELVDGI